MNRINILFKKKRNRSISKEDDCWQLGYYNREPYRFLDYLSSGLLDACKDMILRNNTLIVGPSGTGKTPLIGDILKQTTFSFCVIDFDKFLLSKLRNQLVNNGYRIKMLDLENPLEGDFYNPLKYCKDEEDAELLAKMTVNDYSLDSYYKDAAITLISIYIELMTYIPQRLGISYTMMEEIMGENTIEPTLVNLNKLNSWALEVDGNSLKNGFDKVIDRIVDFEAKRQNCNPKFAVVPTFVKKYYHYIRNVGQSSGEINKGVLLTIRSCLSFLNVESIKQFVSKENMNLSEFDYEKTALFIELCPCDKTYNFLAEALLIQLNKVLRDKERIGGPLHISIIMDNFPHIGSPEIVEAIQTDDYKVSYVVVSQSIAQLAAISNCMVDKLDGKCKFLLWRYDHSLLSREDKEFLANRTIRKKIIQFSN